MDEWVYGSALGEAPATVTEENVAEENVLDLGGTTFQKPETNLTNMDTEKEAMSSNMAGIGSAAESALKGVQAGEVGYGGTDAERLKRESALDQGTSYVTPEATVAGQLDSLLKADSVYMQNTEKRAKEQAAELGLLGSSMAVGAAQRAAIESAMPIAQQDAKTYAEFAIQEQATSNEMSRMKAESDLSAAAREHIFDIDTESRKLQGTLDIVANNAKLAGQAEFESYISQAKAQWDYDIKSTLQELDANLQIAMDNNQISAREREWASTNSTQVMAAAYGSINDLLANPEFMASYVNNKAGMNKVFNNFINFAKDQAAFVGSSAHLADEYMDAGTGFLSLIGSWT